MASKEFRRSDREDTYTEDLSRKIRPVDVDPLFDREWEVFVIRRDEASGKVTSHTTCERSDNECPSLGTRLSFC